MPTPQPPSRVASTPLPRPPSWRAAALLAVSVGCGPELALPPHGDQPIAPAGVEARARDGSLQLLGDLPHWPRLRVTGLGRVQVPATDDPPVWLLAGAPDAALLDDLRARPLTKANLGRAVPTAVGLKDGALTLTTLEALAPAQAYTLAIGEWWVPRGAAHTLPLPLAVALRTSDRFGGAQLVASLPAAGQAAVPTDLPSIQLAFSGAVQDCEALRLRDADDGAQVASDARALACDDLHTNADTCCTMRLRESLAPRASYSVDFGGLSDRFGAPVVAPRLDFASATHRSAPAPALAPMACALDEQSPVPGVCVLARDSALQVHVRADQPTHIQVAVGGVMKTRLAARGEVQMTWTGLQPGRRYAMSITLAGVGGGGARHSLSALTAWPLKTVAITEVRADPLGPEPAQEYVELWNHGTAPVDIDGFTLADAPDSGGMRIGAPTPLAPGERVLLVADGFQAAHPDDASPPPGTRLIRIGQSLASKGLKNAGEPLFLRDREGQRVSGAPATPKPKPGVCLERVTADPTTGAPGDFALNADHTCTPGR